MMELQWAAKLAAILIALIKASPCLESILVAWRSLSEVHATCRRFHGAFSGQSWLLLT